MFVGEKWQTGRMSDVVEHVALDVSLDNLHGQLSACLTCALSANNCNTGRRLPFRTLFSHRANTHTHTTLTKKQHGVELGMSMRLVCRGIGEESDPRIPQILLELGDLSPHLVFPFHGVQFA